MSKQSKSGKSYPKEFREKAVKLATECGYTIEQTAKHLGCSKESVRRWKQTAHQQLDPEIAKRMTLEENEVKALRKEIAQLKKENEILKKATAYFARDLM
jgi:transposase